jgi:hypothetical protein
MSSSSYTRSIDDENRVTTTVVATGALIGHTVVQEYLSWIDSVNRGEQTPGWRKRLKDGESATTTLTGYTTTAAVKNGVAVVANYGGWSDRMTGDHLTMQSGVPSGDPATLDTSKANAEALGRLNQAIRGKRTTFEGGVFLGELGQTIQMIRRPAQGLRKLTDEFLIIARAIRRKPIRNLLGQINYSKIVEHLSDAWLEHSFGWQPLLHDVRDGCKALDAYNTGRPLSVQRVSGKHEVKGSPVETVQIKSQVACTWEVVDTLTSHSQVIYRGAMRVNARDPKTMDPALLGFDLRSFGPTVWELIPYSFLIDYFSNVGDIVTGWSNLGTELAWCNCTKRTWYSRVTTSRRKSSGDPFSTFTPAKFVCTKKFVSRAKYEGGLTPDLVTRVPRSGSLRWLNIAALIGSRNADRRWSYD